MRQSLVLMALVLLLQLVLVLVGLVRKRNGGCDVRVVASQRRCTRGRMMLLLILMLMLFFESALLVLR